MRLPSETRHKIVWTGQLYKSSINGSWVGPLERPMPEIIPAAQYIRMSTEHQRYSPMIQAAAIRTYADQHGFNIVASYEDHGRSGLTLQGREGLKQLLADVLAKKVAFRTILVLDVSRWGRFQDPDQAAHYEFLCREAGVGVRYCSETFDNDGSTTSALLKQMKRVMAGEYSRELSVKSLAGGLAGARLGFKQGGTAPYGLRRMLVDTELNPLMRLEYGEARARAGDKVVYVPGPADELKVVRLIFRSYLREGGSAAGIYRLLKAKALKDTAGGTFTRARIVRILQQRLYAGIYTYNRSTRRLHTPQQENPASDWVMSPMLDPIISDRMFRKVQALLKVRASERLWRKTSERYTPEQLIAHLTAIFATHGVITHNLINATPGPSSRAVVGHFGSLPQAYEAAGYTTFDRRKFKVFKFPRARLLEGLRRILATHGHITAELIEDDPDLPSAQVYRDRFGGLHAAYREAGWDISLERLNILGAIRRAEKMRALRRRAPASAL